jgi:transposase
MSVNQEHLFDFIPLEKAATLSREDLLILWQGEQKMRIHFQNEAKEIRARFEVVDQKNFLIGEQLVNIKNTVFGKSSEKSPRVPKDKSDKSEKSKKVKIQLPSLRYPNAPLVEKDIELAELPNCNACGKEMEDSGLTEDSEQLTTIPRRFSVVRYKRHKYRCSCCHGDLLTAPALPKIKEGSSYSDEMIIDVSLSKYCDLIPNDRYVAMAKRAGIIDLPPNSLIQLTHNLANFLEIIYKKLKTEIINSKIIHADETPHKMLEGDDNSNWSLWGFSSKIASYFETHSTRSGDVAIEFLKDANCEFLVSDVYSGYNKAVRITNEYRVQNGKLEIIKIYCNAHARRRFNDSLINFEAEASYFIKCYRKIYRLEKLKASEEFSFENKRAWQRLYFKLMERKAISLRNSYPSKSSIGKALGYFINNYLELTLFLKYDDVPIDNNAQERLMRGPVIGRKTWYGNHSRKGAVTSAILFSIVESCKLNQVNPRIYFKQIVNMIHQGQEALTPAEFAKIADSKK